MDKTRKFDLEEIGNAVKNAKSKAERDYYEQILWRIMGESEPIRALREDLIMAARNSDLRAMQRIRTHIQYIRMNETAGKSWGSNKGEKYVN